MKWAVPVTACLLSVCNIASCSVVSKAVRSESLPTVDFEELRQDPAVYQGKNVILGGYILNRWSSRDQSILVVLQSPLNLWDKPKSRNGSRGRFIVTHQGFLEPRLYQEGMGITVAGTVTGPAEASYAQCPSPCVAVKSVEVHVHPEYRRESWSGVHAPVGYESDLRSPWYDPGNPGNIYMPREFSW